MKIELNSFGYVKNDISEKKDINWGKDLSEIIISAELSYGLVGLSDFSHIIVVYYLHEAKFNINEHLLRRPQGLMDMPMIGIFAQRAKDRPNPIGITSVELIDVKDNIITVKGLDAVNGTPVLDIKPYFPQYDLKNEAVVPEWVHILMEHYF